MWFESAERFQLDQLSAMVSRATGTGLHTVLAPQAMWHSDDARAQFNAEVDEQYARYHTKIRGEPEFTDIAEVLSTPEEARYGWYNDLVNGVQLAALAASGPRFGLIAVRGTRFFAGPSNNVFGVFVESGSVVVSGRVLQSIKGNPVPLATVQLVGHTSGQPDRVIRTGRADQNGEP